MTAPGESSFNAAQLDDILDMIQLHDESVSELTSEVVRFLTDIQLEKVLAMLLILGNFMVEVLRAMVEFEKDSEDTTKKDLDSRITDFTVLEHWNQLDGFHRRLMQAFLMKSLCFSKSENRDTTSRLLIALASVEEKLWPELPNSLVDSLISNVQDSPILITIMDTLKSLFDMVHDFTSSLDARNLYEAIKPLMNRQGDIRLQQVVLACIQTFVEKHPDPGSIFEFMSDVDEELGKMVVDDQELKAKLFNCKITMHTELLKLLKVDD